MTDYFRFYHILFLSLITLWCFGIITPLIIPAKENYVIVKPFLGLIYSTVCHQQEHKTINVGDDKFFVCSRCAGIYFGVWFTSILSLFMLPKKNSFAFLLLAFAFLSFDSAFGSIGIYEYSKLSAVITGLLFGSSGFLFLWNELYHNKFLVKYEK